VQACGENLFGQGHRRRSCLSLRHCTRNLSARSLSGGVATAAAAAAVVAVAMLVQTALLRCRREGGSRGSSRLD